MRYLVLLFCTWLMAGPASAAEVVVTPQPKALPAFTFTDQEGHPLTVDAFKGKVVVLDFWATWCAPCRAEFPSLDRLQDRLGREGLQVVPISIDHNGRPAVDRFYSELKIAHLDKYLDPKASSAAALTLRGVPTALILDREGREVARIEGKPQWEGKDLTELLSKLLKESAPKVAPVHPQEAHDP